LKGVNADMSFVHDQTISDTSASTEPDDDTLLERVRRHDTAAGDVLVRRYHESLMRYLTRQTRSTQLAEELVQQTWLSALEHLDQYRVGSPAGFRAWLFRIATNKANDLWRSRGRERSAHAGLRLVSDTDAPDAAGPSDDAEQRDKLRSAVDRLPDAQRQVIQMRYYAGLKFQEIADALGCPLNTALGRMHKATQKLKKLLGD
jgi:RNA polymerase sigma-70 factor, ECF subfamily